ncbi:MAG: Ppx/GppA family phosphatase, partial [Mariprofundaceae bacterium]|nr:Ppx/GppA family phosphatase [Mariprofundaceae bacterium]
AAMVFHDIMALAGAKTMVMPDASLLDGVMLDLVDSEQRTFKSQRRNLLAWARSLKKKYHVDRKYGKHVARLSLGLFDQLYDRHQLGHRFRLLLELAAHVHEIGMYVRVGGHHRHAAYLISVAPLLGLSDEEKNLLAQVVRYQRKGVPNSTHEDFAALTQQDQQIVWQLSAVLRLAIALNKERRNRVDDIDVEIRAKEMTLHLEGHGDLLLERWAALKTTDYIEQAFGLNMHIDLNLTDA